MNIEYLFIKCPITIILIAQFLPCRTTILDLKFLNKLMCLLINSKEVVKGIYMPLFEKFITIQKSIDQESLQLTLNNLIKYTTLAILQDDPILYHNFSLDDDRPPEVFRYNSIQIRQILIKFFNVSIRFNGDGVNENNLNGDEIIEIIEQTNYDCYRSLTIDEVIEMEQQISEEYRNIHNVEDIPYSDIYA